MKVEKGAVGLPVRGGGWYDCGGSCRKSQKKSATKVYFPLMLRPPSPLLLFILYTRGYFRLIIIRKYKRIAENIRIN